MQMSNANGHQHGQIGSFLLAQVSILNSRANQPDVCPDPIQLTHTQLGQVCDGSTSGDEIIFAYDDALIGKVPVPAETTRL